MRTRLHEVTRTMLSTPALVAAILVAVTGPLVAELAAPAVVTDLATAGPLAPCPACGAGPTTDPILWGP
jgi:hypothetical protein